MKSKAELVVMGIWLLFVIGWIMNVVKFAQCDFAEPYKEEVLRGIAIIVAPIGAILGWFNI
jgi:uncharacterized membrane protein